MSKDFANVLKTIHNALAHAQGAIYDLPDVPTDGDGNATCCQGPDLRVVTIGLEQWVDYDAPTRTASTDGWDDMGDMNGPTYLTCVSCIQDFRVPGDLDWR